MVEGDQERQDVPLVNVLDNVPSKRHSSPVLQPASSRCSRRIRPSLVKGCIAIVGALAWLAGASAASAQLPDGAEAADAGPGTPAAPPPTEALTDAGAEGSPASAPAADGDAGSSGAHPGGTRNPGEPREYSPAQLGVVEVTALRLEETLPGELAKYGTRVETIHAAQIENAGKSDVAQSLETLAPGLYISPKNGPFDYVNVSLQGSRTQDILWLLDGVRLNNRLYGGTTPLDTFPASIVDRLEILEGPQALFFGTQAVAGAVNIVTKGFSGSPDGAMSLGGDTNGGRHLDAYFRTSIHDHRFVVYGSGDQSSGYQPFRDQDYQPSATSRRRRYEVLTLGVKYGYDFRPDLRLSALYQHTDARLDFAQPFLVATAYNDRDEHVASLKLDYTPSPVFQAFTKAYLHLWRSHYTEFDNVVGMPGSLGVVDDDDFWGYRDYGVNVVARLAPTRWFDSFFGYDFQSYEGSDAVLVITQKSESVHAVFAQVRTPDWLANPKLALGARYNVPSFGPSAAVWSASGRYDFGDVAFVRGLLGTAFRLPTAEELFANDPDDERGDPELKPEKSFNINLSVGGHAGFARLPGLSWEVIGFYRDVTDLISASGFDATTNQSLFENVSGTVRVRGATAVIEGALSPAWSTTLSYSYASAEQTSGQQIDLVPRHQGKASVEWSPTDLPVGASVFASYVGDAFRSFGADDREKISAHVVVDVAARVFLDGGRHHKINVSLSNVFDTTYATSLGKGVRDADGSDYTYWNLGTPRTLSARYTYRF
jgi:outer membrane cobalamin receptor